jgi:hypothetical protein
MISDDQTNEATNDFSIGELNDGADVFNSDSSMFYIQASSGAGPFMYYLNAANCINHTGTCLTKSQITAVSNPPVCTSNCYKLDTQGQFTFSRTAANIIYQMEADNVHVDILTVCRQGFADAICSSTASDTFTVTPYANFTDSTLGVLRSDFNALWSGVFGVSTDGSITIDLGGEASWQTAPSSLTTDVFALPVNNVVGYSITGISCIPGMGSTCTGSGPWTAIFAVSTAVSSHLQVGTNIPIRAVKPGDSTYNGMYPVTATGTNTISVQITGGTAPSCTTCTGDIGYAEPAFQVTTAGAKGSVEPDWQNTCPAIGDICTDGTATWTAIGDLNGQGPGFYVAHYGPPTAPIARGYSLLNTRTGRIFRGAGEYSPPNNSSTPDPSGTSYTTDGLMCVQFGYASTPPANGICPTLIPYGAFFTIHDSASTFDPTYQGISATGGGAPPSKQDYAPADVPDCLPSNANYRGEAYNSQHTYAKNDTVWDPANPRNMYICTVPGCPGSFPDTSWAGPGSNDGPIECYKRVWHVNTNIINECMERNVGTSGGCAGHEVHGYMTEWGGTYLQSHLWSEQTINGVANPGVFLLPKPGGVPGDQHGMGRNQNPTDTNPVFSSNTDVPTWTYAAAAEQFGGQGAGYGEYSAVKPDGSTTIYRFAHSFNSGVSRCFSCQNNIGAISQDGQWGLLPSDFMGTRGSNITAGAAGNGLRAMYAPNNDTAFNLNDTIFPVGNNAAGNIYEVTQPGTTGDNIPAWSSVAPNPGNTICDPTTGDANNGQNVSCAAGQVQWTNRGPSTGRSDVMLIYLLSAH